jgi:predicted DNA repair protein MutK
MAGSSLLALIDDIATILDDVAVLSKVAVKKTAGVLGDDLALNAQQVTGVEVSRELPVVWAVAKGSFCNKAILVPAALIISALLPWAVTPLLMAGGLYLCYEGFEKVVHTFLHSRTKKQARAIKLKNAIANPQGDLAALEKEKIKGAIRTDFILSAEIIVIALGTVAAEPMGMRVAVLTAVAIGMTIGVYGLVAAIVKLDDAGLFLSKLSGDSGIRVGLRAFGIFLVRLAPWLMKFLSLAGTVAMFLVGGGILAHGIPAVVELIHLSTSALGFLGPVLINGAMGIVSGGVALLVVTLWTYIIARFRKT